MIGSGVAKTCEDEVIAMLVDLRRRAAAAARSGNAVDEEEAFDAEENARLVKAS